MISINQPMQALFKHLSHIDSRDKLTKKPRTSVSRIQTKRKKKIEEG